MASVTFSIIRNNPIFKLRNIWHILILLPPNSSMLFAQNLLHHRIRWSRGAPSVTGSDSTAIIDRGSFSLTICNHLMFEERKTQQMVSPASSDLISKVRVSPHWGSRSANSVWVLEHITVLCIACRNISALEAPKTLAKSLQPKRSPKFRIRNAVVFES